MSNQNNITTVFDNQSCLPFSMAEDEQIGATLRDMPRFVRKRGDLSPPTLFHCEEWLIHRHYILPVLLINICILEKINQPPD